MRKRIIAFLLAFAAMALAGYRVHTATATHIAADFAIDHQLARAYVAGRSPYTESAPAYRAALDLAHPPTTPFWFLPLAPLSLHTASIVLGWLSLLLLLWGCVTTARLLAWPEPAATGALVAAAVANSPMFMYLVALGQISQVIAATYLLAWWALRRGRERLAGAALGAACTLKLFPGVAVVYLLVTRRWRAFGAAVGAYVAVAAVMTARFGLASWPGFFRAQHEAAAMWVPNLSNMSIHGVVQQLVASPACELIGAVAPEGLALSGLLSLVLLALAARAVWRLGSEAAGLDLGFAIFAALSVVISQWAWEHYAVLFVMPAMVLATVAVRERWHRRLVLAVVALLVVSTLFDSHARAALQVATLRGAPGAHLALHLVVVAGWLPAYLLLAALLWRGLRRAPAAAAANNYTIVMG